MQEKLIKTFYHNRNQERAGYMAAYMKGKFPFLGISKPERAALQRAFVAQAKKDAAVDWSFVNFLWALPEREFQYLALDYLLALKDGLERDDVEKVASLIINKSWWDTVDNLATIVGALFTKYPELIGSHIAKWTESPNIWLVRIAILFQLKYKEKTDTRLLGLVISQNSGTKEFFINKAIGWALREYSKTDKEWVRSFIGTHRLHPLSVREGSKHLD